MEQVSSFTRRLFGVSTICKHHFQRLLSFGSSDDGGGGGASSITTADVETPPSAPLPPPLALAAADRPLTSSSASVDEGAAAAAGTVRLDLDHELLAAAPTTTKDKKERPKPWHEHVGKTAQPASLFFAGIAVALFMNPMAPQPHAVVLVGHTGAIYLGFCMGAGLSIYSIFRRPSPAAARVQVKLMLVGFGSVLVAIVFRTVNLVSQVMMSSSPLWLLLLLLVPGIVVLVVLVIPPCCEVEGVDTLLQTN